MIQRQQKTPAPQQASANPFADVTRADCEHWAAMARNVNDPVVAKLLVQFLDQEPDLRVKRSGVYLAAQTCLQRHELNAQALAAQQQARAQKLAAVGHAVGQTYAFLERVIKAAFEVSSMAATSAIKLTAQKAKPQSRSEPTASRPAQGPVQKTEPMVDLTFPVIDFMEHSQPVVH
jgi:hypothetical protein